MEGSGREPMREETNFSVMVARYLSQHMKPGPPKTTADTDAWRLLYSPSRYVNFPLYSHIHVTAALQPI